MSQHHHQNPSSSIFSTSQHSSASLPVRKTGVFVERTDILEDLLDSTTANPHSSSSINRNTHSSRGRKHIPSPEKNHATRAREFQSKQLAALTHQSIMKSIEATAKRHDSTFLRNLQDIESAQEKLGEIEASVRLIDENEKQKFRRQFEDWNSKVHGLIQVNIAKQINAIDPKQLNKKKCEDYQKFLDIVNKKPSIFRDIIIESEYDPLEVNRRSLVAKTAMLNDPTNIDAIKFRKENAMLVDENNKPNIKNESSVLCKETLPVQDWAAGRIDATPYGAFAKMMTTTAHNDGPKKDNPTQRSHIHFNDFDFPRGKIEGRSALDAEMPRGKRIVPQKAYPFRLSHDLEKDPLDVNSRLKSLQKRLDKVINEGPANEN